MDASDAIYDREEGNMSEHPVVESAANIRPSGTKNILVSGGGKEFGKQIKAIGGRWNVKERGYILPNGKSDQVQALVDRTKASESAEDPASSMAEEPAVSAHGSSSSSVGMEAGAGEHSVASAVDGGSSSGTADPVVKDPTEEDHLVEDPMVETPAVEKPVTEDEDPGVAGTKADGTLKATEEATASVSGTSSSASSNPTYIVQLNTRYIAVLGDIPAETHVELNKHGKFNKALKVGDKKRAGWSMGKSFMDMVTRLLPGISLTTADKLPPTVAPAAGDAPAARSPKGRKSSGSSKSETPATSPDTPEKEKRKRQRTSKAEESAVQAHAPHAGEQPKVQV